MPLHTLSKSPTAFTLIEMLLGLTVLSTLILALASAIVFSSKALPDDKREADTLLRSSAALNQMADELRTALYIAERTSKAITVVLPDRTGDGQPDRVRYAWSGVAGQPLTRSLNGATAVTALDNVQSLTFSYQTTSTTTQYPGALVESAETLLSSYYSTSNNNTEDVKNDKWWSQYFKPSFEGNVYSWKVTRAFILAREKDSTGNDALYVQLRLPETDTKPSSTIIDSATIYEGADLGSTAAWVQATYSNASGLNPTQGLCLTLTATADPGKVTIRDSNVSQPDASWTEGNGTSWNTPKTDRSLLYYVYGTTMTPTTVQTLTRTYTQSVRIQMQAGTVGEPAVDSTIPLMNRPELLSAMWEADFKTSPTSLDSNGDGSGDWIYSTGGPWSASQVVGGVWKPGVFNVYTNPANDFLVPTTIELRWRDTVSDSNPVWAWFDVHTSSGWVGRFLAGIALGSDGKQVVALYRGVSATTWTLMATYSGLSSAMHDLKFIVNPQAYSIAVFIDDGHRATYTYPRIYTSSYRGLSVQQPAAGGEIARVRVRAGGSITVAASP